MTAGGLENGGSALSDLEAFADFAWRELADAPLHRPGVCFLPECSCEFETHREWQMFCSPDCKRAARVELTQIGRKAAPALLAWRAGKYARPGTAEAALARIARRYLSRLQSAWIEDRAQRVRAAEQRRTAHVRT